MNNKRNTLVMLSLLLSTQVLAPFNVSAEESKPSSALTNDNEVKPLSDTKQFTFGESTIVTLDSSGNLHIPQGTIEMKGFSPSGTTTLSKILGDDSASVKRMIFDGPVTMSYKGNLTQLLQLGIFFNGFPNLVDIENISYLDTGSLKGNAASFIGAFASLKSLNSINLSQWNTTEINSATSMFSMDTSLISADLSNWDLTNMTNIGGMFAGCTSLTNVNFSNWKNMDKVTSMNQMFQGTSQLKNLDISNFNTKNVTNMRGLFYGSGIESINLKNWDTSNVENTDAMFLGVKNLKELDISSWNMPKVTSAKSMFSNSSIEKLNISSWDNANAINSSSTLFSRSNNLKELTLGDKFKFNSNMGLVEVPKNETYTGYWQNVGSGTTDHPTGSKVWTTSELVDKYDGSKDADTYVWQPRESSKVTLNVKDISIFKGDSWDISDNFISGTDRFGNPVTADAVDINGASAVNTNIPGTYNVTYKIDDIEKVTKVTVEDYLLGDINRDGKVNILDLTKLRMYINQTWKLPDGNVTLDYVQHAGDINKDGKINLQDYSALMKILNSNN